MVFWKTASGVIGGIAALFSVFWIGYEVGKLQNEQYIPKKEIKICNDHNRIIVISLKGKLDQRGVEVRRILNTEGCDATGPSGLDKEILLLQSEIRYFHKSDFNNTKHIADYLTEKTDIVFEVHNIRKLAHKAPKGYLEIWLK